MAEMNLRDYAETAKIAAMVGGGVYLPIWSGSLEYSKRIGEMAGDVKDLVNVVINPDEVPISQEVAETMQQGSTGLGSGALFWLNPSLMTPGFNSAITASQIGVKATSAYIVIRARDFDSSWRIKETAYKAAVGMHSNNKTILEKHVLVSGVLKTAFRPLVKTTDFVIIYPDGSFRSA